MKKGLLIFDFDGTIADTKSLYYKAVYNELKKFHISYKKMDRVIDLGLSMRKSLKKFGLSFLFRFLVQRRIMKNVKKQADKVKKCRDTDYIKKIKTDKILVSNSLKEFILPIVRHFKLRKYFKEIYGSDDFSDKGDFIKWYMEKNKIKKENCCYIGDRAADVKTARKAGCKSIIISGKCAWNSKKEISKEKPDFIIKNLGDLKKVVG